MMETYSFTIPSLADDTPLDCRIYHPDDIQADSSTISGRKGAVIAHPYAPLGGSQDDAVVMGLTQCLLKAGHIVATFNFRGAGDSAGKTSWTGHSEVQDYVSVVGLLVYYLHQLNRFFPKKDTTVLSPVLSNRQPNFSEDTPFEEREPTSKHINILLGGYSFGSLILVRLPSISSMIHNFEIAEYGTTAFEIHLRAKGLARRTQRTLQEPHPATSRARKGTVSSSHSRSSPITVGGEETDPSERRRSKDSHRRSISAVRELPHRIKTHVRRHSGSSSSQHHIDGLGNLYFPRYPQGVPQVTVRYLLVSPVLFPLSTMLLPPGLTFPKAHATDINAGALSLRHPTLLAFGDSDHFTSAKKLRQWAQKLASDSAGLWKWSQIDGAGHFWREEGVSNRLETELVEWVQGDV